MLWLYLHFPQLQLDLLNRQSPSEQAVIIVETKLNRIVQANAQAKKQGIELGMGLASAVALHKQLKLFQYRAQIENQHLQQLAQALYQSNGGIVIEEPDGLLLETSSMLLYHRGLDNYWRTVLAQLEGLSVHYSTAYSPTAAKLLARSGINQISDNKKNIRSRLNQLDINRLPLPQKKLEQLHRLGIRTLGKLLRLPLKELAKRFDIQLLKLIGQINNELKTPLDYFQPKEYFRRYLALFYEIDNAQQLLKPLPKLLAQLEDFLRQRNAVAEAIELVLQQREQEDLRLEIRSGQGLEKAEAWLELCRLRFERLQLQAPVESIEIICRQYQQQGRSHRDLFSQRQQRGEQRLLIDHLQARLGADSVLRLSSNDSHIPEQASELITAGLKTPKPALSPAALRPIFLHQQPRALTQELILFHGPERIQSQWWQREIQRDYYIARDPQGRWCWIFKDQNQRWFLQGYFS